MELSSVKGITQSVNGVTQSILKVAETQTDLDVSGKTSFLCVNCFAQVVVTNVG